MAPGKHPDVEKAVVMVRFSSPPQPCRLPHAHLASGLMSGFQPQVSNGMVPLDAWQMCGQPNGSKGIQNLRKRGLQMRKFKAAAASLGSCSAERLEDLRAETPGCEEEGHAVASTSNKGVPAQGFRLSTTQASAQVAKAAAAKNEYDRLCSMATQEWADTVCSGKCSSHSSAAKAVAGRHMSRLPAGYRTSSPPACYTMLCLKADVASLPLLEALHLSYQPPLWRQSPITLR